MRRTSSIVAGAACMPECGLRTISSDSTPLDVGALILHHAVAGPVERLVVVDRDDRVGGHRPGSRESLAIALMKRLPGDMLSMLVGIRLSESPVAPAVA